MHPIERLRYVARTSGDACELVEEAADALVDLSGEPRVLLTASRRLLDAHPECGPLWWLAARVLCSVEPGLAAELARELIAGDVTAEELAASLPGAATVVAAPSRLVLGALSLRPDCTVRLLGAPSLLRSALRQLASGPAEVVAYLPEEANAAVDGASVVLVEALAAATNGVLVARDGAVLARSAGERGTPAWLVAGQGCVLPPALFEACAARAILRRAGAGRPRVLGAPGGGELGSGPFGVAVERLAPDNFALVVSTVGSARPGVAFAEPGCPAPSELTRLAG